VKQGAGARLEGGLKSEAAAQRADVSGLRSQSRFGGVGSDPGGIRSGLSAFGHAQAGGGVGRRSSHNSLAHRLGAPGER